MNEIQKRYISARAAYEVALEELSERTKDLDWDADFDSASEYEKCVRAELGCDALSLEMVSAEKALLKWLQEDLEKLSGYDSEFDSLFSSKLPSVREGIIDVAMRYRPENDEQ